MTSEPTPFVTLQPGVVASLPVLSALLDLERRGATFRLLDNGKFRVEPMSLLTPADVAFLRAHRDEAHAILRYQAPEIA